MMTGSGQNEVKLKDRWTGSAESRKGSADGIRLQDIFDFVTCDRFSNQLLGTYNLFLLSFILCKWVFCPHVCLHTTCVPGRRG